MGRGPQTALHRVGQIAGQWLHPRAVRLRGDPGDGHAAGLSLDHEEDEVPLETASVSPSTVNRSQAARPSQCACTNAFHGVRRARSGVLAPFAVGDMTYPLARKGAYATEQVAGAISGRNLLQRNVLTSQHQQRTAQAPCIPGTQRNTASETGRRTTEHWSSEATSPCG